MDLNRETAMRLWNKSFGKETKAEDFSGRMMAKGAYNDRNSAFGWNVDHILPQSRGGATADHNLICCHISTNDEKADRFPCFSANGVPFQIVKVQNHYEIERADKKPLSGEKSSGEEEQVDFFDSASGLRLYRSLEDAHGKRFVGTVCIYLQNVEEFAVVKFIETLFKMENLTFSFCSGYYASGTEKLKILIRNFDMPQKSDTSELLDRCILLNTYFSHYFLPTACIGAYDIYYRLDCYQDAKEMYRLAEKVTFPSNTCRNSLYLNGGVISNTDAAEKVTAQWNEYAQYDYVYTNLSKHLDKEVKGN